MRTSLLLPILLAVVACADSKSGSGVDSGKRLGELSAEEARALWDYRQSQRYQPTPEERCTVGAIVQYADEEACRARVPACIADLSAQEPDAGPVPEPRPELDRIIAQIFARCPDVTVARYESCQRALREAYAQAYGRASCDRASELFEVDHDLPECVGQRDCSG